jgi:DNA-binding transcriptional ArsR family regulator
MANYSEDSGLDDAFAALADPTRREIVERLGGRELTVSELAEPYAMALPTVSRHLKVLERARLVSRRIDGRRHWIRLEPAGLGELTDWLSFHSRFWCEGMARIDAAIDAAEAEDDR